MVSLFQYVGHIPNLLGECEVCCTVVPSTRSRARLAAAIHSTYLFSQVTISGVVCKYFP
jgi:hypothetical protein